MPRDISVQPFRGFCVASDDLSRFMWDDRDAPDIDALGPGQILVAVARFAFTANNVTYARLGATIPDAGFGYWDFFPAPEGWGCIPVWGIGEVIASRHPEIVAGERVYGYFPMASHLVLQPGTLRGVRFVDGTSHRATLLPTYNEYVLIDRDRTYDKAEEDAHLVLRPLFSLSFCCAAFLKDERCFGARRVLISSASSKAALGLACLLAQERTAGVELVALTSAGNASFVAERRLFDRVVGYDEVDSLTDDVSTAFVDIAGNGGLIATVHNRLGDALTRSVLAGFTHRDSHSSIGGMDLPGPRPELFFTPQHIVRRRAEWGADGYRARFAEAWRHFVEFTAPWLVFEFTSGREGVERIYRDVLDGKVPPDKAHILSALRQAG